MIVVWWVLLYVMMIMCFSVKWMVLGLNFPKFVLWVLFVK